MTVSLSPGDCRVGGDCDGRGGGDVYCIGDVVAIGNDSADICSFALFSFSSSLLSAHLLPSSFFLGVFFD